MAGDGRGWEWGFSVDTEFCMVGGLFGLKDFAGDDGMSAGILNCPDMR